MKGKLRRSKQIGMFENAFNQFAKLANLDSDLDGVPDFRDCRPFDPTKHYTDPRVNPRFIPGSSQTQLLKLYTTQATGCYYCQKELVTPREVWAGECMDCMQKHHPQLLKIPMERVVFDRGMNKLKKKQWEKSRIGKKPWED